MMASIYEMARQRIAAPRSRRRQRKSRFRSAGHLVKAKEPKKPREKHEPTPEEIEERKAKAAQVFSRLVFKAQGRVRRKAVNGPGTTARSRESRASITGSHKEECDAASKKWRDEHKERYNARMRAYRKKAKIAKAIPKPLNLARFSGFFCL